MAFCLVDGSILSAPYEAGDTRRDPLTRNTSPTEILRDSSGQIEPKQQSLSTIQAPAPQFPFVHSEAGPTDSRRNTVVPWLLMGIAILLVAIFVALISVIRSSQNRNSTNTQASAGTTTNIDQPKSACGHMLASALYDKWIELGAEGGKMGCPATDESEAPASPKGTTGRWIQFARGDGGYLILHRSGPHAGAAFEVDGCMFKLYASQGGPKSWLGFPVGDGFESSPGGRQEFEGGYIVWDSETYVCNAYRY